MDPEVVAVVIGVALLAATAQSTTGFGFALIAAPCLVLVLDVKDTVVVVSVLALATEVLLAARVWAHVQWGTTGRLLAGSFVGMPLGLLVLVQVPEESLRVVVALAAIVLAGGLAMGLRLSAKGTPTEVAVGALSGLLQTSTSMSGPPVVSYLVSRGHGPQEFRGTITMYFLVGSVVAIAILAAAGVVTGTALLLSLVATPAVLAGSRIGHWLISRIDAVLFRRLVLALLFATALSAAGFSIQRLVT